MQLLLQLPALASLEADYLGELCPFHPPQLSSSLWIPFWHRGLGVTAACPSWSCGEE